MKSMEKKKHLPLMGVGPVYVCGVAIATAAGIKLKLTGIIQTGTIEILRLPFFVTGIAIMILGLVFWACAVFQSKVDANIKNNTLVTTGVYSYVRNPIYSGLTLVCIGALFAANNLWLLILPVVFWIFMTLLMKNTEEKWLKNLYGPQYVDYCKKVNRCIPWFRK